MRLYFGLVDGRGVASGIATKDMDGMIFCTVADCSPVQLEQRSDIIQPQARSVSPRKRLDGVHHNTNEEWDITVMSMTAIKVYR